jgi:hypothetical protein
MAWTFAGTDGQAAFEFADLDGEAVTRRRRVGGHEIFERP